MTTVFTTKPTGRHTRKPTSLDDDSPTYNGQQCSPSITSNTSNQAIGRHTSSTCTANLSEMKIVLTYSVLAQLSQQNFLHFNSTDRYTASNISDGKMALTYSELAANLSQHIKPTNRHWSTCTANISEGEMVLTHSVCTTLSRTSNLSTQPIGSHTSTWVANLCERWYSILCVSTTLPTAEFPTLQPNS